MSSSKLVQSTARSLGLTQVAPAGVAYGVVDGYLAQVQLVNRNNAKDLKILVRHAGEGKEGELRRAMDESPEVKASGIEPKQVRIDASTAVLAVSQRFLLGLPDEKVVLSRVHAFLGAIKSVSRPEAQTCRLCVAAAPGEPVLLAGVVDRICPSCTERLESEAQEAAAKYDSRPVNLPLGLAAAVLAGAAGGALYGGVMVATHRMLWALAIITGAMVGYAAVKGAGKGGSVVQAMAAVVTVVSVLAGLLGFIAYQIHQQVLADGATVDWGLFLAKSPQLLVSAGRDSLFSLGGGLFGAWTAIKRASPPKFQAVHSAPKPSGA